MVWCRRADINIFRLATRGLIARRQWQNTVLHMTDTVDAASTDVPGAGDWDKTPRPCPCPSQRERLVRFKRRPASRTCVRTLASLASGTPTRRGTVTRVGE